MAYAHVLLVVLVIVLVLSLFGRNNMLNPKIKLKVFFFFFATKEMVPLFFYARVQSLDLAAQSILCHHEHLLTS